MMTSYDPRMAVNITDGPVLVGTRYRDVLLSVQGFYPDGTPAIRLFLTDDEGFPTELLASLTVGLEGTTDLGPYEFVVKNYSENEGLDEWLESLSTPGLSDIPAMDKWVHRTGVMPSGFVTMPVYRANEGTPLHSMIREAREHFG